ncbi:hypothetical protein BGZ57DRAFT_927651 [Hyaloscypha finlandica]|nr:hypothetical protein BGZ57DRAFT_927651 [Hyaloscypha finlandica]KAH8782413.1 hypothetical protein F5882DRAFT_462826 [Hyaloscypha sp. PMI_1271]
MAKRLWTTAIFTVLLSPALITTTGAGMAGIIAATATYAAVQVVFIGTSTPGTNIVAQ